MIRNCGVCARWIVLSPSLSTLGSCPVEAERKTKGVFRAVLGLMPYHEYCEKWEERETVSADQEAEEEVLASELMGPPGCFCEGGKAIETLSEREDSSSEQGRDGKLCRECDGFKVLGHFAKDRSGMGQCRTRRWNPRGDRAACEEYTERRSDE